MPNEEGAIQHMARPPARFCPAYCCCIDLVHFIRGLTFQEPTARHGNLAEKPTSKPPHISHQVLSRTLDFGHSCTRLQFSSTLILPSAFWWWTRGQPRNMKIFLGFFKISENSFKRVPYRGLRWPKSLTVQVDFHMVVFNCTCSCTSSVYIVFWGRRLRSRPAACLG